MAYKLRKDIPEQNDILDYTNEMIDELEALKAIAGRTGEEKKEENAVFSDGGEAGDTQGSPASKARTKKAPGKKTRPAAPKNSSEGEEGEGYFRLMLYLPKDYGKKFRLIRAVSDVDILGLIREDVLGLIDGAWAESRDLIESEVRKIFK